MKLGWKRLLKLADILDVADAEHRAKDEPLYCQEAYMHACGSPACALGHYAANRRRRGWGFTTYGCISLDGAVVIGQGEEVQNEFEIDADEAEELFDADGCGDARTAKQAARYIRLFLKRKEREVTK